MTSNSRSIRRMMAVTAVAVLALGATAPTASAARYLSMDRALTVSASVAEDMYYAIDDATDYDYGNCVRMSRLTIDCETNWTDEVGDGCENPLRVRASRYSNRVTWRFLPGSYCF